MTSIKEIEPGQKVMNTRSGRLGTVKIGDDGLPIEAEIRKGCETKPAIVINLACRRSAADPKTVIWSLNNTKRHEGGARLL